MTDSSENRGAGATSGNGAGRAGRDAGFFDSRDAEIARLKLEQDRWRARERVARAEAEQAQKRLTHLARASRMFAISVRSGAAERQRYRRRIAAQYAVSRTLADAQDLEEAAPKIMRILGERLGWEAGVLWTLSEDELRCESVWCAGEFTPSSFEEACRQTAFPRGVGLPGRAWSGGEPVRAENLQEEDDPLREAAAEAGFRGAIAFPVRDGSLAGVFEFFRTEEPPRDEILLQTSALLGQQISQFVERRRAEEIVRVAAERDRFRVALSDALRPLSDPVQIQAKAAQMLGTHLGESQVYYGEITEDDAHVAFERDYADGVSHLAGRFRLDDFGQVPIGMLRDGRALVVPDVSANPDLSPTGGASRAGVGAQVCIPLVKGGRLAAVLAVYQAEPRAWTSSEIALIKETAERTWLSVEHARAEEALRRNEARWRALIDKGADVITISNRDGTIRFASPSVEAVCGYTVEEFVGIDPFEDDHIHPDDLERCGEALREMAEHPGRSVVLQHRYRHKSDGWRWLEGTFVDLFHDPAINGLIANFRDVTERKEAEEERDRLLAREWVAGAQVEERRRLSRELHDRVAHDIALVHQSLELHETLKTDEPAKARAKMKLARERVKAALHTTRNLSMELRQPEVRQGLEAALSNLLRDVIPPTVVSRLIVVGDEETMPFELRNQVFVILREAVRNAVAHSGCGEIVVDMSIAAGKVVACVEDDGRGFDVATTRTKGGIRSMRERAALAGADFEVSSDGAGTRVTVSAPLEEV